MAGRPKLDTLRGLTAVLSTLDHADDPDTEPAGPVLLRMRSCGLDSSRQTRENHPRLWGTEETW